MRRLGLLGTVLALAGALGAAWAASRPWYHGDVVLDSTLTGQALTSGLASALALAALVALVLQLVFGVTGRRVLAVLIALFALAAIGCAVSSHSLQVLDATSWSRARTPAFWGYLAAAGIWLAGAVLIALRPQAGRVRGTPARGEDAWHALDRGADPTAD